MGKHSPVSSHMFVERLFALPNIKVCAFLTALDCIDNIVEFVSGSFVLQVNQFLSHSFGGSEVNWDVMLDPGF